MEIVYKTCVEMLNQRGYEIIEEEEDRITAIKQDGCHICVFITNMPKLDVNRIKEYVALMNELGIDHSIIVYGVDITPYARKVVETSKEIKIELFPEKNLKYNVTKHKLVPQHERLSEDDANEFKKKYGIKFGGLLLTDPVSRFYGYERGDVIKITRVEKKDKKSFYITYRIVR